MAKRKPSNKDSARKKLLAEARELLILRKKELTENVSSELRAMRENEDKDPLASDMDDVSGESDNETTYRLLEIGSAELEEIEYALERIDEGTYGVCEECDEPIGVEGLEALPFTAVCIKCKRLQESESGEYY